MAEFKIKTEALQEAQSSLEHIQSTLRQYESEIRSVANGLNFKIAAANSMRFKINNIAENVNICSAKSQSMSSAAEKICESYTATENVLKDTNTGLSNFDSIMDAVADFFKKSPGGFSIPTGFEIFRASLRDFIKNLPKNGTVITYPEYQGLAGIIKEWYNRLNGGSQRYLQLLTGLGMIPTLLGAFTKGSSASLFSVGKSYGNDFLGIDGKLDFLTAKQKGKLGATFNLEEGDANVYAKWAGDAHLVNGSISGSLGLLHGEAKGSVGNVGAEGEIGATLFENGQFMPSAHAKAKVSASVLEGSAETRMGTEDFNRHMSAKGTVLGAEASAEGAVGKIAYKNSDGRETITYGAMGKVGAEAYLAEGEISGGFTIFGIKIDAALKGKAGGAGVEASGAITTGGLEGDIGLGLGLGAGVKLKIDWSGFKWPWSK